MNNSKTWSVLEEVFRERQHQHSKFGDQAHLNPFQWIAILGEEFGEVCKEAVDGDFKKKTHAAHFMRKELIQLAAVAVQWAECLERGVEIEDVLTPKDMEAFRRALKGENLAFEDWQEGLITLAAKQSIGRSDLSVGNVFFVDKFDSGYTQAAALEEWLEARHLLQTKIKPNEAIQEEAVWAFDDEPMPSNDWQPIMKEGEQFVLRKESVSAAELRWPDFESWAASVCEELAKLDYKGDINKDSWNWHWSEDVSPKGMSLLINTNKA